MGINKCFVLPQLTQRAWRRKLSRGYLVLEHWIILAIKLLCIPAGQLARCWTGRLPPAPSLAPLTTPLSLSGSLHRFQQISYCAGWRRGGRGGVVGDHNMDFIVYTSHSPSCAVTRHQLSWHCSHHAQGQHWGCRWRHYSIHNTYMMCP